MSARPTPRKAPPPPVATGRASKADGQQPPRPSHSVAKSPLQRKIKPAPPGAEDVTVRLNAAGASVTVPLLFSPAPPPSGQHTITWFERIKLPVTINGKVATLPPGSCNLYKYPRVFFEHLREGKAIVPPLEQLYVLEELVRTLVLGSEEAASIAGRRDGVGATPLHGLLVANTKASLSLALSLYTLRPELLTQCHAPGPFVGENGFHILAVNGREAELCKCVRLAASRLKPGQLKAIFWKQATGVFFTDTPMSFYGGTPVSYAVAFSMQEALRTMLTCALEHKAMGGILDFNDPAKSACKHTGLLPLHVAVANSLTTMFNFLVDLPGLSIEYDDFRARPEVLSQYGTRKELALMTPLQVAVKLGEKKLVQYILRTQSKQQWEWGPVSSYNLDLKGIDSVGDTANDVMEICANLDAREVTQEMLLDEFMGGLLHKLFRQKFEQRGLRWVHLFMRLLDVIYLSSIYMLAMMLRADPAAVLYPTGDTRWIVTYLPYVMLFSIVPLLEEDLRVSFVYWLNSRSGPQDPEMKAALKAGATGRSALWMRDFKMLLRWMQSHNMPVKFVGWACAISCALLLLDRRTWAVDDARWDPSYFSAWERTDIILIPLSVASFLHGIAFFSALLFQFEKICISYRTCFQMLTSDVRNWAVLFAIFLLNYGMVMYIAYPRFGFELENNLTAVPEELLPYAEAAIEPAPQFMGFVNAAQSLFELGFIGERVELNVLDGLTQHDGSARATMKLTLFVLFVCFYLCYITMSLILLLNLLIAMMGDTYAFAKENATRQFRVNFARRVLRLELQMLVAARFGLITLNCGERVGDTWVHNYRNYTPNAEGGGTGGKTSMFEDDVEKEAEEDEADDDGPGGGDEDEVIDGDDRVSAMAPVAEGQESEALAKLRRVGRKVVAIAPLLKGADGDEGEEGEEDVEEEELGEDV